MAIKRLRQIKKEIRVIGVAARCFSTGITIIGVVYRGSFWLDGVLKTHHTGLDITESIVEMIKCSRHYGQIRVVLLSRDSLPIEVKISKAKLNASLGRPVIVLGDEEPIFYWRNGDERRAFSVSGLSRWSSESILKASTRTGVTPEAIRVATLILSTLHDE